MLTNKELKENGRQSVKKHYFLLLILCAVAVLFGNEFSANDGVLHISYLLHPEQVLQQTEENDLKTHGKDLMSARMGVDDNESLQVIKYILNNDLLDGIKLADELEKQFESSGTEVEGHTQGFLAYTINSITSGTLFIKVFQALDKITGSNEAATIIFVLLGLLLYFLFGVCVPEIYAVVLRRMFLEARVYENIPLQHTMHLLKVRRAFRATMTIILKDFFHILWSLTIVGFFIKRYSYFLVPFIAAENPDIKPREAITLSRKMMDGHKMEAFKFELSFLHWVLLGIVTLGVSNVFWYLPYKIASTTEYYACMRRISKDKGIEGVERLDDEVLLAKADRSLLEETYRDVAEEEKYLAEHKVELEGKQKFFAEKLAIWLGRATDKVLYQEHENREYRLRESLQAREGLVYPERLDPRYDESNRKIEHQVNFLRCYTIWNLMFMFLLFAFIGWVWEVIVFLIQTGAFVNRGTLHGPWVPIYGVGGAMIIVVLSSLRKRPVIEFFAIVILCGVVEYFTSWALEKLHNGMRWWDYSGYFLNLDGRVCAEGLIAFGVLGMMAIYLLAPALDTLLMKIDPRIMAPVTSVLMAIFFADVIYSQIHPNEGTGITDMGSRVEVAGKPALPYGEGVSPPGSA